jgi:hypothetical protein|nr:MAG TPA: hypothetical protein [Caudoviricetes sp.]
MLVGKNWGDRFAESLARWDSRLAIIKRLEDIGIVTYILIDGITEVKIVHASKTLYVAELDDISKLYAACCYADADYRIQPA